MAKRVLPIHLDEREREILRRKSASDKCSMAEVVRRQIRALAVDVLDVKKSSERPAGA
jgi:hypothetical protein